MCVFVSFDVILDADAEPLLAADFAAAARALLSKKLAISSRHQVADFAECLNLGGNASMISHDNGNDRRVRRVEWI